MKIRSSKAVSTTLVIIIIIVLVVAAGAAIYASQSHNSTTTVTSTASGTVSTTTVSGSSSGSIPANEIIEGVVGPQWGSANIGDDVMCGWSGESNWYNNNYEQLFQYSPADMKTGSYVPIPWLATSYNESADGLTYTINLHSNVHFHSGNAMTAADVVYSIDRFVFDKNLATSVQTCPAQGFSYRDSFGAFKNISATGTYQVTLTLNYPDANVLAELSNQGMSILDSKLLQSHTVTGANGTSDYGFVWLDGGTSGDAGTGPFMLTSFTYQQRVELQKFSNYWGGPYNNQTTVQTLIFIPYADATTAQFAVEQGQVNIVQDETDDAISSLSTTPGISINTAPGYLWMNLYMHPVGPLADWRVRDAVKEAIDYNTISKTITDGYDKPDASFFGIGMQGYTTTTANFYANQAPNDTGAKALLKAAGYANGFTINLYTRPSSRFGITFVSLAEVLVSDLAAVNISLVVQVYVVGQFYNLLQNFSLPGMWTVPSSLIILSPLSQIESVLGNGNSTYLNWSASTEKGPGVPFAQMVTLYGESQKATNPTQAISYEQQLDVLYQQYGPTIPIIQIANTVAYSSSLKGVVWNAVTDSFIPTYLAT